MILFRHNAYIHEQSRKFFSDELEVRKRKFFAVKTNFGVTLNYNCMNRPYYIIGNRCTNHGQTLPSFG